MVKFLVTYEISHVRVFDVPDESYIESVISAKNGCRIIKIEPYDKVFGKAVE